MCLRIDLGDSKDCAAQSAPDQAPQHHFRVPWKWESSPTGDTRKKDFAFAKSFFSVIRLRRVLLLRSAIRLRWVMCALCVGAGLESERKLDTSKLNDAQIAHIQQIIDDIAT